MYLHCYDKSLLSVCLSVCHERARTPIYLGVIGELLNRSTDSLRIWFGCSKT